MYVLCCMYHNYVYILIKWVCECAICVLEIQLYYYFCICCLVAVVAANVLVVLVFDRFYACSNNRL